MQKYLPRDLSRFIRGYVSNPREDYEKVVEELKIHNDTDKYENIADRRDGFGRTWRITYNYDTKIICMLKQNEASIVRDDKWTIIVTAF